MKKVIYSIILISIILISLTGCNFNKVEVNEDALKFKEEYESKNNTTDSNNNLYRTISIREDNPFVYSTGKEIVKKIENKETFYVYFGSTLCPWCRSVIEKFIEVANENNIETVYYVDIWDGDHNEILRDTYKLNEKGKPELVSNGDESYQELLKYFDSVLSDYTLTNKNGKSVSVGEKRIFAPNFIYVDGGIAKKLVSGISPSQKDSREQLTDEMLIDEEEEFKIFFKN